MGIPAPANEEGAMTGSLEQVTVYTPDDRRGGVLRTALHSFRETWRFRQLVWTLFTRDFKAQFKQSLLGYFWTVVGPILGVVSFVLMNFMGILRPGATPVPYPLYAFVGTSIWGFLMSSIGNMSGGLNAHAELIMRTNVPKIALVGSALANIAYGALVNVVLILFFTLLSGVPLGWGAAVFPLLTLPLLILGTGIGLAISVIGIVAKDVSRLVNQFFGLLMFLTPVFYVADQVPNRILHRLIMLNPLTYLVEVPRDALFGQPISAWPQYWTAAGGCFLVFLIGIKVFDLVQDLVAERL
jgi:lipopolysaccharide transport system permease protein